MTCGQLTANRLLLALILLLSASGCFRNLETGQSLPDAEMFEAVATNVEPVPFTWLGFVMPEPGRTVAIEVAEMNSERAFATELAICLSFNPGPLMEPGDYFDSPEEVFARLSLEVDGETFTEFHSLEATDAGAAEGPLDPETGQPQYRIPGGAPYIICYPPELEPGVHQATFVARKTSGEELRYSWSFGLFHFPEPATLQLPPLYILEVRPGPGEALTIDQYLEASTFESLENHEPGICVRATMWELRVELPDNALPNREDIGPILASTYVEVNGSVVNDIAFNRPSVGSVLDLCYQTILEPGIHTATLYYGQDESGNQLSYSWSFVLLESQ